MLSAIELLSEKQTLKKNEPNHKEITQQEKTGEARVK